MAATRGPVPARDTGLLSASSVSMEVMRAGEDDLGQGGRDTGLLSALSASMEVMRDENDLGCRSRYKYDTFGTK